MARLMARGLGGVAAYRVAFGRSYEPIRASSKAWRIAGTQRFKVAMGAYRTILERESRQRAVGMRDFVLGRLTIEAQTAPESAARIKALDLLGKTEGMFTTVHRTEKTMDAVQLQAMKAELYQRIRATLGHAGRAMPATLSHDTGRESGTPLPQETHPRGIPLITSGSHPEPGDTIPPVQSATFTEVPPSSPEGPVGQGPTPLSFRGPVDDTPGGVLHREMEEGDL